MSLYCFSRAFMIALSTFATAFQKMSKAFLKVLVIERQFYSTRVIYINMDQCKHIDRDALSVIINMYIFTQKWYM